MDAGGRITPSGAESELERARSVQLTMLPPAPTIDTFDIACSYRACDMLGGDFYDFILIDAWRVGIVIADVSGHGTAAALLAAAAKKVLQMCGRGNLSPRQTLLEVNDSIRADIPSGMFLSVLYGVIDIRSHRLCFASCGHNPLFLQRGDRLTDEWKHGNAPVVGVLPSTQLAGYLHEEFVQLEPGDRLLFYTDGLTEAFDGNRAMFGEARMRTSIGKAPGGEPQALIDTIRADVDAFRAGAPLTDDETMVVIRVGEVSERVSPLISGAVAADSPLPIYSSKLIGREKEVAGIVDALFEGTRPVVTVTGPAGAGKTRVAVAAAEEARDAFPAGVRYVDLQQAGSLSDVCRQVATSLNLGDDETRLQLRIAMALQSEAGRSLLVLDNCDRASAAVKECVNDWVTRTPSLQVLASSRAPLEAKGEACHPLRPLPYPKPGAGSLTVKEACTAYASMALFVQRAEEADRGFRLTEQNLTDVGRICARLDGLPQALELAAARVSVLTPRQILERLDKRFELLGSGDSVNSTLESTLAMSWDVLGKADQTAWMLLSLYPNGFQLDTAATLLGRIEGKAPEDLVNSLLKQSLLHFDVLEDLEGDRRFFMYESVRAFGREKLKGVEFAQTARKKFETVVMDYVLKWWREDMDRGGSIARRRVLHELETLLEIVETTQTPETRAWATVIAAPVLYAKGEQDRAMTLLRGAMAGLLPGSDEWMWIQVTDANLRATEAPDYVAEMLENVHGDPQVCFQAAMIRSTALQSLGRSDEAIAVIHETSKLDELSPGQQARMKDRLAVIYGAIGRPLDARRLLEAALKQAREHGDPLLIAKVAFNLGWINVRGGRVGDAVKQLREAYEIADKEGDRVFEASCLGGLALALHVSGKKQESEACALRGIRLSRELGRTFTEVAQLNTLTRIYHEQGRDEEALEVALRARKLAQDIGSRKSEALAEGNVAAINVVLGNNIAESEAAWRRSYDILLELGEVRSALSALSNLGVMMGERWKAKGNPRDLDSAISNLKESVIKRRDLGYDPMVDAELLLAELMVEKGQHKEARELLLKTLETARERGDDVARKTVTDAEELLSELDTASIVSARPRGTPLGKKRSRRPTLPAATGSNRMAPSAKRDPGDSSRIMAPPLSKAPGTPPPVVKTPPSKTSSQGLPVVKTPSGKPSSDGIPVVKTPPSKTSSEGLPVVKPRGAKPASASIPPLKSRRPKGKPGAAPSPRRRPRGYS
ncbi:MAG: SpoIIE family protein phosphatase [Planctomycetes bacterium]|nr:SpoIIE family protein phosphatase [Planctomycetota bacterium]